jgi:hypothetical protein
LIDSLLVWFSERVGIMTEHLKNVESEHAQTAMLLEAKQKELDTEKHQRSLADREAGTHSAHQSNPYLCTSHQPRYRCGIIIGRLRANMVRIEVERVQYEDKLHAVQNKIVAANETLEKHKLDMNWNQEELLQWALAAKQKEEDHTALLK